MTSAGAKSGQISGLTTRLFSFKSPSLDLTITVGVGRNICSITLKFEIKSTLIPKQFQVEYEMTYFRD